MQSKSSMSKILYQCSAQHGGSLCRYDSKLSAYVPYAKSWIKEQLGNHIRKQFQGTRRR